MSPCLHTTDLLLSLHQSKQAHTLLLASGRTLGCCTLKLLPKVGGSFRVIFNLASSPRLSLQLGFRSPLNQQACLNSASVLLRIRSIPSMHV